MDSDQCDLLREGFLDVKFPPDSPERVLYKAWRKLWIRAFVLQPLKREPSLILEISRSQQEKQSQSLKASRDGLQLFRCRSGSRPLQTWALSSGTSLIVYLAAENEEETQSWMQTIRDGLWPAIQNLAEKSHDVSLIDDEKTFSTGILGLYGRLVKTPDGMTSIIHPHWQGILLRWKQEDVVNIQFVRKVGEEASDSGVFKITLKSSKTETRSFYFYSTTAKSTIDWLQLNTKDSLELSKHTKEQTTKKQNEQLHNSERLKAPISENIDTAVYATINKTSKELKNEHESKPQQNVGGIMDKTLNDEVQSNNFLSTNISSDLLDASLNFTKLPETQKDQNKLKTKSDEDSDEATDTFEHVYEDMIPKASRSDTVYEDIQNSENEYVPPLPPPLPTEKPKILRLLKLSESVAEALKLAEDVPVVDKNPKRPQDSTAVRETTSQLFEKKPILRRSSEPNII